MHAKHDYNPIKTAYPIDSIPSFDDEESKSDADEQATKIEGADDSHTEEDLALLEKLQQPAFHQSKDYQGANAYRGQRYEPGSTELESTVSWTLLIGCSVILIVLFLIGAGILSLTLMY